MKKSNLIIFVLVIIIVGAGSFFGGTKYQQSKQLANFRQFGSQTQGNRTNQGQGNRQAFRPINGDIIGSDDKSITVKLQDGSSKIVLITDKTVINKASSATKADLKTGEKIAVIGQENTNGTVNAQNIQLNPIIRATGTNPTP